MTIDIEAMASEVLAFAEEKSKDLDVLQASAFYSALISKLDSFLEGIQGAIDYGDM